MCQRIIPAMLQVCLDSWLPCNPLHVKIPLDTFSKFHLECCQLTVTKDEEFIGIIIKEEGMCSNYTTLNVFVSVQAKTDLKSEECDYLPLYVTTTFVGHYCLENNSVYYFKTACCFPLEKIVLGARCEKSYQCSKSQKWPEKFLLASIKNKVLCRVGDVLLISPEVLSLNFRDVPLLFDFFVLDCFPVGQGYLTTNTSVILTNNSEVSLNLEDDFKSSMEFSSFPQLKQLISCLFLMNYAGHLVSSRMLQIMSFDCKPAIKTVTTMPNSFSKTPGYRFRVQIIPKLSDEIKDSIYSDHIQDSVNKVFLTNNALQKLGITQGAWVKIRVFCPKKTLKDCNSFFPVGILGSGDTVLRKQIHSRRHSYIAKEINCKCRLATVSSLSNTKSYDDDVVCVTPQLWFNLNTPPSKLVQPHVQMIIEPLPSDCDVSSPSYASEIYVALVQSPNYNANINCYTILQRYFSFPRYVSKGDILAVNIKDDVLFLQKLVDPLNTDWPIVYFRVSMIECAESSVECLADTEHTRIYQSGTIQTFIPVMMETYNSTSPPHAIWDNPLPPGIEYYIKKIEGLVLPFFKFRNKKFQVNSNILLSGLPGCGKTVVAKAICKNLNLHFYQVNCHEFMGESPANVETKLKLIIEKASAYVPCVMLLKNIDFIGKEKEVHSEDPRVLNTLSELLKNINSTGVGWPVITIATTSKKKLLNSDLSSAFLHHVHMKPPSEEERYAILSDLLSTSVLGSDVSISYFAQRTAGFVLGSLSLLVSDAKQIGFSRAKKFLHSFDEETDALLATVPIIRDDLLSSLDKLHASHAESIGAPQVPNIQWEDVGGLHDVKQEILDTIQLPLEHPEISMCGLQRSGVLLYGPPGTGKTLLAKAVATECSLNFLSVKGPELINMYVGQSEENIREVFSRARGAVPCVIFFDELDSLAPNRGKSGDSGGVMDRVVSQLLSELDGLNKASDVFVIGATNRPDLIDPALLRPGRFDRHLYVGIPEDKKSRVNIMTALTRKFSLAADVSISDIVDRCPPFLSGADFYSLCCDAMMNRIEKNIKLIEEGHFLVDDANLILQAEDFDIAMDFLTSSVTAEELIRYKELKNTI